MVEIGLHRNGGRSLEVAVRTGCDIAALPEEIRQAFLEAGELQQR